ncbi:MAG: preprotein translocase subunit YajC [Bernardetiaceae bacterium]|nr:preprotein translocase subunit YajC [Bernardetiaceae bacterium]
MLFILLQAGGGSQAWLTQLLFIGGIVGIFYFFMIRPQQRKQKEQANFSNNLKEGDKIVTVGGLHGKVVAVEARTVVIEADKGVRLRYEKSAISFESTKAVQSATKDA